MLIRNFLLIKKGDKEIFEFFFILTGESKEHYRKENSLLFIVWEVRNQK